MVVKLIYKYSSYYNKLILKNCTLTNKNVYLVRRCSRALPNVDRSNLADKHFRFSFVSCFGMAFLRVVISAFASIDSWIAIGCKR